MEERLQKIIARAGVASRRHAEQLIVSGQVAVNGKIITELGTKADIARDHIRVAGKLLHESGLTRKMYIILNKPAGVVATMSDPEGRATIADALRGIGGRVFPVGRLEYGAAGLVLVTSDGELSNRMMRAHGIPQIYQCKISGALSDSEIREAERRAGVKMQRAKGLPAGWWEVKVANPSRDVFRETLFAARHHVDKLKRVALANLELDALPPGQYRHLTADEVAGLERAIARAERGGEPFPTAGEKKRNYGRREARARRRTNPPRDRTRDGR